MDSIQDQVPSMEPLYKSCGGSSWL